MLKKVCYGVAFLMVWMVSVGVTAGVMDALRANGNASGGPAWSGHPNPLKIEQPTHLTKHEMFSEDHTADVVAIEQVWAAYTFYTDTDDGPGMASIFTPDGVDHHLWNDGHGKLIPDFGIVAPGDEGKNMTPMGPRGSGCVLRGRDEISQYKRMGRVDPLPWPAHFHHETTSIMVKVSDDGQTAVLATPSILAGLNAKGEGNFTTGEYRAFFKKTSEGWEMAELYTILDNPVVSSACDVNGNLPRTFTPAVPQP